MKIILASLLLLTIPYVGFGQKKAVVKSNAPSPAKSEAISASSCKDHAEGLRIMLSGKDYDEEGVTDINGKIEFKNVPAGDMVVTKTGEDKSFPTCRFVVTSSGGRAAKTGTFKELTNGVSFRNSSPGIVVFNVK